MSHAASKALAAQLQQRYPKLSPAQHRTMEILLNTGKVYLPLYSRRNGRIEPRSECLRSTADQLTAWGFIRWVAFRSNTSLMRSGYYELTPEGREFGLTLSDKQSSASRQHWIETGRYLKYGDREEFAPPAPFSIGDVVQRIGRPGTCKYRINKVIRTVDNTFFYDVQDVCTSHDPDDNPMSKGQEFPKVIISTSEYAAVQTASEERSVTDHIAKFGKPFAIGDFVQTSRRGVTTTDVHRVKSIRMIDRGWMYVLVNADGEEHERRITEDSHHRVNIVKREIWEAQV